MRKNKIVTTILTIFGVGVVGYELYKKLRNKK